jgi:hypothetical protein
VYDVAAKVKGVTIADVTGIESENGQLRVVERYDIHNASTPPTTQWSKKSFEVILPPMPWWEMWAQRPGGQPADQREARSRRSQGPLRFQLSHPARRGRKERSSRFSTLPYSSGKYTFHSQVTLPAIRFRVVLPKSHDIHGGPEQSSSSVSADPTVQTFLMQKGAEAGKTIRFTVSGTGRSRAIRTQNGQGDSGQAAPAGNQPGRRHWPPINTPDPLSKYKWWILGGLALLLAAAAAFLLRKPAAGGIGVPAGAAVTAIPAAHAVPSTPAAKNAALLNALKEELFALESERIAGTLPQDEYAEQKAALETVLKRALKKS